MTAGLTTTRPLHTRLLGGLAACLLLLVGCQPAPVSNTTDGAVPHDQPATRPVDAAYLLRDRLLQHDGAGFAKIAVPPTLYAELETGWRAGRSRWPLDELPLDARIPRMLAALQAKDADKALMRTFRKQFAGADADIDQAVRTLVIFGSEYVDKDPDYTAEERQHTAQAIAAIGHWALAAPLSDPKRAQFFFSALSAAAVRSGIDGSARWQAFANLGMTQSLNRLSPFFATLLVQLHQQYGLDSDAALRSLRVSLQQQTGDQATLRLQYTLAGQPIDALVPAERIDGHWYLSDFVRHARLSLALPHA